jgi:hypothetical protein
MMPLGYGGIFFRKSEQENKVIKMAHTKKTPATLGFFIDRKKEYDIIFDPIDSMGRQLGKHP